VCRKGSILGLNNKSLTIQTVRETQSQPTRVHLAVNDVFERYPRFKYGPFSVRFE
jgi:hypothetical protein